MASFSLPYDHISRGRMIEDDGVVYATSFRRLIMNATQVVEPVWRVELMTKNLKPYSTELAQWQAWKSKLSGGLNTFLAYDPRRPTPLNYLSATGAGSISSGWDGTADVTSLGASGVLGLASLPAGYVVSVGDYIGLEQSGVYDLYRVIVGGTANGSGVLSVTVKPFLRDTLFTTSAVARLWRPVAAFLIEDWSEPDDASGGPISFSGVQRLG